MIGHVKLMHLLRSPCRKLATLAGCDQIDQIDVFHYIKLTPDVCSEKGASLVTLVVTPICTESSPFSSSP